MAGAASTDTAYRQTHSTPGDGVFCIRIAYTLLYSIGVGDRYSNGSTQIFSNIQCWKFRLSEFYRLDRWHWGDSDVRESRNAQHRAFGVGPLAHMPQASRASMR